MSEDRAGEDMSAKAGFPAPGERVGLPALTGQWHFDTLWIALLGIHRSRYGGASAAVLHRLPSWWSQALSSSGGYCR